MTVADYIDALQKLPQDAEVVDSQCRPIRIASPPELASVLHPGGFGDFYACQKPIGRKCYWCDDNQPTVTVVVL